MSEKVDKQGRTGESLNESLRNESLRNESLRNESLRNESLRKASPDNKTFRELRESGSIYVDKTSFAESLLSSVPPEASIILHPHGFGKSLNMSMLRDFCDIRQDSRAIFEGLAISENKEVCDKWMNQYPVVLVSFKDVGGETCEQAMKTMASAIGTVSREFAFLTDSEAADEIDRRDIRELIEEQAGEVLLSDSLYVLSRILHAHFKKRAIVLIDDYDVPLLRAQQNGYYKEMAQFLGSLYGATMKGNEWLEFGVLTGCLPYTNHSDFSGFNNFVEDGMSDVVLAGQFGFTSEDVDKLLTATGFSAIKDEIQEWYKGYLMGKDTEVFCPRDIMAYIATLQENPDAKPDQCLCSPSDKEVIQKIAEDMIDYSTSVTEDLLAGGCIHFGFNERQFFGHGTDDERLLWAFLYMTGFLTTASEEQKAQSRKEGRYYSSSCCCSTRARYLVLPNKRLRTLLMEAIDRNFREVIARADKTEFLRMFWAGDTKALEEHLEELLMQTATYYDVYDGYYHDFLTELFAGTGCEVSQPADPLHRTQEIVIPDPENDRCAVIEIKHAGDNDLSETAEKALSMARAEAADLKGRYKNVVIWGMGFWRRASKLRTETA